MFISSLLHLRSLLSKINLLLQIKILVHQIVVNLLQRHITIVSLRVIIAALLLLFNLFNLFSVIRMHNLLIKQAFCLLISLSCCLHTLFITCTCYCFCLVQLLPLCFNSSFWNWCLNFYLIKVTICSYLFMRFINL